MYRKNTNTRIAKILHKERELEESNPGYRIEKAIQDLHKLEKYYVVYIYILYILYLSEEIRSCGSTKSLGDAIVFLTYTY